MLILAAFYEYNCFIPDARVLKRFIAFLQYFKIAKGKSKLERISSK